MFTNGVRHSFRKWDVNKVHKREAFVHTHNNNQYSNGWTRRREVDAISQKMKTVRSVAYKMGSFCE
jgi:predicted secreted protein